MPEYKYFLDTNIFLRSIVKDSPRQSKDCQTIFELIQTGKLKAIASFLVLAELVWTGLSLYRISKKEIIDILKGILKLKGLKLTDKFNLLQAVSFYELHNIKFIDALIASNPLIFRKKIIIVSYDKDFDKFGIVRLEPKEIISKKLY